MSDLFGNHIVGFPTKWLILLSPDFPEQNLVRICVYRIIQDFDCGSFLPLFTCLELV